MKKNYLLLAVMAFICCCFIACTEEQSAIAQLEDFAAELEENGDNYTFKDWSKASEKYLKIEHELAKNNDQYTDEELKEIGRLKGKCVTALAHSSALKLKSTVHSIGKQMEGASGELKKAAKELKGMLKKKRNK